MENITLTEKVKSKFKNSSSSNNSCLYFLGIIGAAIHYISTATSFTMGVAGLLKSLVWPAILVYEVFQNIG